MQRGKPILCLDFDGVIHSYSSGWKGADVIPDPLVAGALQFIRDAAMVFAVQIFSSRSNQPGGIDADLGQYARLQVAGVALVRACPGDEGFP